VAEGDEQAPDWRDAAAYRPLLDADRSFFAWEWLRRNPHYRAAAERALQRGSLDQAGPGELPLRWRLHAFEPPGAAAPAARPVWSAETFPSVLAVEAASSKRRDAFDLGRFDRLSTLVPAADGREHLLISDGLRAIRVDVLAGSLAGGPSELSYRLTGLASAERPLLTLRRLLALWRTGDFSRSLHPREARAMRWLLMLRACDALAAGADQREIAALLLSAEARQPRWRTQSPSVRSRVQRLVRSAQAMEAGGFWTLLSSASATIEAVSAPALNCDAPSL
jgi:hypothetical protein